jgi:prepilin-type processing-associated H-X9-DG protein
MMSRTILSAFAAAVLLSAAANAPAAGQTYNPYVTVDAPDLSKKRSKRANRTQFGARSGARSGHSSGANVMLMDGSVRFVRPGLGRRAKRRNAE